VEGAMENQADDLVVEHDPASGEFRVDVNGQVGKLVYRRDGDTISLLHTEVPEEFEGQGIAGRLAHAGLEFARAEHLTVVPICPFVAAYIRRHSEYQPLVRHR
jgi:uncharacterized protein